MVKDMNVDAFTKYQIVTWQDVEWEREPHVKVCDFLVGDMIGMDSGSPVGVITVSAPDVNDTWYLQWELISPPGNGHTDWQGSKGSIDTRWRKHLFVIDEEPEQADLMDLLYG